MKIDIKKRLPLILCFLTAFCMLMLCSRSSFLYPCNDWDDANSYFTMGKSLMHGKIIYRDLYDQKGPYLYLLYGIAYLISHTSFLGVFVLEILAIAAFLYYAYKCIQIYCSDNISIFMIPLLAAAMLSSKSFYWGGAAEEFCLPLLMYALYSILRYWKNEKDALPSYKLILVNGVLAGIIMQVKYTILGFHFAWIAVLLLFVLSKKKIKEFFLLGLTYVGGMIGTLIPWLIFFGVQGALDDWFQCYIYNNIFLYSNLSQGDNSIGNRIYVLAKILMYLILDNCFYFIPIIIGAFFIVFTRQIKWVGKVNLICMLGLLFLGIYVGGSNLPYYSIPLMTFAPLGFIPIGILVDKLLANRRFPVTAFAVSIAVGAVFAYNHSMNSYFMKQEKMTFSYMSFGILWHRIQINHY